MQGSLKKWFAGIVTLVGLAFCSPKEASAAWISIDYIYWNNGSYTDIAYGGSWGLAGGEYSPYINSTYSYGSNGVQYAAYALNQYSGGYDANVAASYQAAYTTVYVRLRYYYNGTQYQTGYTTYALYK